MSGDSLHALEGMSTRLTTLSDRASQLKTLRNRVLSELCSKEAEIRLLSVRVDLCTKVSELFRVLMDLLVTEQVRSVESVVSEGLRTIFHDLDLNFEAEVSPKYNKIAVDFYMRRGLADDPTSHRGSPLESFGGGPASIADLILRMLTVFRLKRWPLLILDEALAAVSDEYVEGTAIFLQSLAKKMGVDILLVTHKAAYLEHADGAYRCFEVGESDGTTHLDVKAIQ